MISQWRKDEMRIKLKALKKTVDDNDKASKAKLVEKVVIYDTCCSIVINISYRLLSNQKK